MPVLHSLPLPEMEHIVRKSQADRIICCESLKARGDELAASTGYAPQALKRSRHRTYRHRAFLTCLLRSQSQARDPHPAQLPLVRLASPDHFP